VVAEVELADPPRHTIEESGIDALTDGEDAAGTLFSIVTALGVSASARRSCPSARTPMRGRRGCSSAAAGSCPRWRASRRAACGPARVRSRRTGARCWGR